MSPQQDKIRNCLVLITAFALFGLLPACPRDPVKTEESEEPVMVARGIITAALNRYVDTGSNTPFEQFSLLGMFVRYDAEESNTIESLLDANFADVDLALDSCSLPAPVLDDHTFQEPSGKTAIELLDVGNLEVKFGARKKLIPTRTFPDLLKKIVGVLYTSDETKGVQFRPGETYSIRASGTEETEPFRVSLDAPADLGEVKVDGIPPGEQVPVLRRDGDIELTWDGDAYGDEIIAELSWTTMGTPWAMTCRMRDDGLFILSSIYTSELPDPLTSSDEELTLSRIRQVSFRNASFNSGSFRFIVSTNFPVHFDPRFRR